MATPLARAICLTLLVGSIVRAAGGRGQEPDQNPAPPPAQPTFSSESNLVMLQVTVFDRHGEPVPQTISMFSGEDAPVAVGLVLDNSSSMLTRRGMVMAGVKAFAESSKPDDQAFSIVFNEDVTRGLPPTVEFTSNTTLLQASIAA